MSQKVQWFFRLVGFIILGASLFSGKYSAEVGAAGAFLFVLGTLKFKKKKN